ncbi:hypothetical protein ACA910_011340 [Epithemia clementina (nom. ined.)]
MEPSTGGKGTKKQESKNEKIMDWDKGWLSWLTFRLEHGKVEVPPEKPELARWVEQQRDNYKSFNEGSPSELNEEKITRMSDKGFIWSKKTSAEDEKSAPAAKRVYRPPEHVLTKKPQSKDEQNTKKNPPKSQDKDQKGTDIVDEKEKRAIKNSPTTKRRSTRSTKHADSESRDSEANAENHDMEEEEVSLEAKPAKDRPVTPEMEKMSAAFAVEEDVLAPLEEHVNNFAGFDEDEGSDNSFDADDTESDEEWDMQSKPRERKKRTAKSPPAASRKKSPPPSTSPEIATPGFVTAEKAASVAAATAAAAPQGRYPRRSTRRTLSEGDASADTGEPDAKKQKVESKDAAGNVGGLVVYNVLRTSERTGKKEMRSYSLRQLRRLVPEEKEEEVREQCRVEYADILVPEEPLEPDKKRGIDHQTARSNASWEANFLEYLVFQKVYGHGIVPKIFSVNPFLGRWTVRNRRWMKSKDKRLTKSRIRRLKAANFVWEAKKDPAFWAIQQKTTQEEDKWELKFNMLLEYKKEHGDCLVPKEFAGNMVLARWVGEQRKQMKAKTEGRHTTLTDDREQRLHNIGFIFNTRTREHLRNAVLQRFQDRWNICFERLLKFKEVHGHAAVPRRFKADKDLASWAMRQRSHGKKYMRGEKNYLTKERFELLKSVDFVFEMDRNKYPLAGGLSRGAGGDSSKEEDGNEEEDQSADAEAVPVPMEMVEASVVEEAVAAAVADQSMQMDIEDKISGVPLSVDAVVPEPSVESNLLGPTTAETALTSAEAKVAPETEPPPKKLDEEKQDDEHASTRRETRHSKKVTADPVSPKPRTRATRNTVNDKTAASKAVTSTPPARQSPRLARHLKKLPIQKSAAGSNTESPRKSKKAGPTPALEVDTMRRTRHSKMMTGENPVDSNAPNGQVKANKGKASDFENPHPDEVVSEEHETGNEVSKAVKEGPKAIPLNKDETSGKKEQKQGNPVPMDVETETLEESNADNLQSPNEFKKEDAADSNENAKIGVSDEKDDDGELIIGDTGKRQDQDDARMAESGEQPVEIATDERNDEIVVEEGKNVAENEKAPIEPEPTPEELRELNLLSRLKQYKGVWVCEFCEHDEHLTYVSFLAHEAKCAGLKSITLPTHVSLE